MKAVSTKKCAIKMILIVIVIALVYFFIRYITFISECKEFMRNIPTVLYDMNYDVLFIDKEHDNVLTLTAKQTNEILKELFNEKQKKTNYFALPKDVENSDTLLTFYVKPDNKHNIKFIIIAIYEDENVAEISCFFNKPNTNLCASYNAYIEF